MGKGTKNLKICLCKQIFVYVYILCKEVPRAEKSTKTNCLLLGVCHKTLRRRRTEFMISFFINQDPPSRMNIVKIICPFYLSVFLLNTKSGILPKEEPKEGGGYVPKLEVKLL